MLMRAVLLVVSFFEERPRNMGAGQNVISDAKSVLNMSITMTVSAQKPPAPPGYISISRKKLLQNLEINAGGRINAWVDSMRASSPTHIKSTPSLIDDQSSWNVSAKLLQAFRKGSFFGWCSCY